jgi:sigma-B regulation protein RsbU (phosphoserine phosphatase)
MRVLIADDDVILRRALEAHLARWGYEPEAYGDGASAWAALQRDDAPTLIMLDWQMPGVDGAELCRQIRLTPALCGAYVILLTGNTRQQDVVSGLESGADEYITKPFDWDELHARLRAGTRIVRLQQALTARVSELQTALSNVRRLSGLVPICAHCKRIRDDRHYWQQIEEYVTERSEATFTHGICPPCRDTHFGPLLARVAAHADPLAGASTADGGAVSSGSASQ